MKSLLRRYCVLLALLIYWVPQVHAQDLPKVSQVEIRHVGPPAASEELIKANIRLKQGDPYSRESVDEDVRNLYSTGYFYNIRVSEERAAEGVKLLYIVQGKPVLTDTFFEGNDKLSDRKLKKQVGSKVGQPLDERKLFEDAQKIREFYQKKGYQQTEVKYVLNINEGAGRGSVTFEIQEAPKVKIEDIVFVGADAFKQRKLRRVIKTRRHWMFSWLTGGGVLKDDKWAEDQERLRDHYQDEGYIDFAIRDVKYEQLTPKKMEIRVEVFEGQPYKVGSVVVKGNDIFTEQQIRESLKMGEGQTFTPKGLAADREAVYDVYGAKGYIDTGVATLKTPNVETGTMDLSYEIDEKELVYVERIEIRGNTKTKDKVIRRELAVSPGEPFDMVRVKRSRSRLEGLDFFNSVKADPEETEVPDRRNLVVSVEEKNTGNLSFGAGFSTIDSVVGFIEVSQGNFDLFHPPTFQGGGQKFRLRTQVGTQRQDYLLSFVEPWFLGRKLSLGVDLYHRQFQFLSDLYEESRTGGSVSLTKALGSEFIIGRMSYTLENVGINDVDINAPATIKSEAGRRLVSKVGGSIAYDTRNSVRLANKGQRTELLTELAGGPFGGDTDFYRLEANSKHFFAGFFEGHIVEVGGVMGVVESYGSSTRVPLFDRNFLGGQRSLRGFEYRAVGPKAGDEPLGGNTYWWSTLEYSLPLIDRLRFAMFYDIGMVYQDAYSFDTKNFNTGTYNDNWGVGLRLNLPIGPLRLDYGIPISSDPSNDSSGQFQFGVGFDRTF